MNNQVQIVGHIGRDIQMDTSGPDGARVFTAIVTKEIYRNAGGEPVIETQWHPVVARGRNAKLMRDLLRKGKKVAVRGKLRTAKVKGHNGSTGIQTEIVVRELMLLD